MRKISFKITQVFFRVVFELMKVPWRKWSRILKFRALRVDTFCIKSKMRGAWKRGSDLLRLLTVPWRIAFIPVLAAPLRVEPFRGATPRRMSTGKLNIHHRSGGVGRTRTAWPTSVGWGLRGWAHTDGASTGGAHTDGAHRSRLFSPNGRCSSTEVRRNWHWQCLTAALALRKPLLYRNLPISNYQWWKAWAEESARFEKIRLLENGQLLKTLAGVDNHFSTKPTLVSFQIL